MLARLDDLMEGSKEQQTLALSQLVTAVQEGEERRNPNLLWRLCKAQYLCSAASDTNTCGEILCCTPPAGAAPPLGGAAPAPGE